MFLPKESSKLIQEQETIKLPVEQHEHYVALVWDVITGTIKMSSSPSLRLNVNDIVSEAALKLVDHIQAEPAGQDPVYNGMKLADAGSSS